MPSDWNVWSPNYKRLECVAADCEAEIMDEPITRECSFIVVQAAKQEIFRVTIPLRHHVFSGLNRLDSQVETQKRAWLSLRGFEARRACAIFSNALFACLSVFFYLPSNFSWSPSFKGFPERKNNK